MTMPPYVDGDLTLRPIREHHAKPLYAITRRDRDHLRRYQNWPDSIRTLRDMENMIDLSLTKSRNHQGYDMVIYHRDMPAGKIGLVFIDWDKKRGEIGYWLGERFQGHGLVTRAAWLLTGHTISKIGLNCVQIRCALANERSRAIPQRLGFRYDGILSQKVWIHGELHDDTTYSMTAHAWYGRMMYHLVPRSEWLAVQKAQVYTTDSLDTQGFIHASWRDQILRVAQAVYPGRRDLVLLCIDPFRIQPDWVEEPADPTIPAEHHAGETFPHIYGGLNLNAVLKVYEFPLQRGGGFQLPPEIT